MSAKELKSLFESTIITCMCGENEKWMIGDKVIKCKACKKMYRLPKLYSNPSYFNENRRALLLINH